MKRWRLACVVGSVLASLSHASALRAQVVVQDCQPTQYVDRTATSASRIISWDFSVSSAPERCMQVQAGQSVKWDGDLEMHPLGSQGGDSPNPVSANQNGVVTFNNVGTFGYVCLSHSSMKGAIKVVAAPTVAARAPAVPGWLTLALGFTLLGSGALLLRRGGLFSNSRA